MAGWDCARSLLKPATGEIPTLQGVDWGDGDGKVALIDVASGEGELQEWGRRGITS